MKRFPAFAIVAVLLLIGLWYANTRLAPLPLSVATPLPRRPEGPVATPPARTGPRVVVISLDSAQAARTRGYIADGTMPSLARLKPLGAMAVYALSVDPPLTGPAHAALATGAYPSATGVVSNRYPLPNEDLLHTVDALERMQVAVESVWRTAMREARRTAAVCWPGSDLQVPASLADYTVTYGDADTLSAQHQVTLAPAQPWTGAPTTYSPLREGVLTIRKDGVPLATVYLLAVDTTEDGEAEPDTFILSRERRVGHRSARLELGQAAPLVIDELIVSGAYLAVTQVAADKVTLYQSRVHYNRAQPNELVREVNRRFGFFPPGPDYQALERGWITPEQYVRMAQVQSRWISAVTLYVLETYRPEVLFAWQGVAEDLQRPFLLVDARQPKHTPERAAQYAQYVRQGYALADAAVGDLANALDLTATTLLVVSDHGKAPVHSQVFVNTILNNHRLLVYQNAQPFGVSLATSKALAYASGGAAHIYINLHGRQRGGTVAEGEYKAVQDAIVAAFQGVKDRAGQPVFSRVLRRQELRALGLDSPQAGDVFVQAAPGYSLTDARGSSAVVAPAAHYGEHGLAANLCDMQAIFLAVGRGIRRGVQVGPVHIVDVAPTVDRLLGLKPPASRAGRVLEEVLLP